MLDMYFKMMTRIGFFMIKWFFKGVGLLLAVIMDKFRERSHEREEQARQPERRPVPAASNAPAPTLVTPGRPPGLSDAEDAYNVLDDARQARLRYMSVGQNL